MTPAIAADDPPSMRNARLRGRGAICIAAVWSLALILPAYPQLLIGGWLWVANNLAAAVFAFVVTARHVSSKA